MKIILTVVTGSLKGKNFSFDEYKKISIGRSPKAFFSFPKDQKISRLHCLLEFAPPYNCYIRDLDSSNGTFYGTPNKEKKKISFRRIQEIHIENNHYIRVGATTFRVNMKRPKIPLQFTCNDCNCVIEDDSFARGEASTFANKYYCEQCQEKNKKQPLKIIGDFEVIRRLGEGSIGVVYLAKHIKTGRLLALKIAHPSTAPHENQIKRFLREAEYGAEIRHKNIVNYYKANYSNAHGFFYIPMEYIPGIDLQQYIRNNNGPIRMSQAKNMILDMVNAINFLHEKKIIHRDIKPANMLIVQKNEVPFLKLADLGLAKRYEETGLCGLTMSNKAMGTPDYLAPEQLENARDVDERADIYSTAATIYHILTNNTIFSGGSLREVFSKIMNEKPIPMREYEASIPVNLEKIVMLCLEKNPDKRVQSMKEFRILLGRVIE